MAMFFMGIVGYALRVHERWFPYFRQINQGRDQLNRVIDEVLGSDQEKDIAHLYKYYLKGEQLQIRIEQPKKLTSKRIAAVNVQRVIQMNQLITLFTVNEEEIDAIRRGEIERVSGSQNFVDHCGVGA